MDDAIDVCLAEEVAELRARWGEMRERYNGLFADWISRLGLDVPAPALPAAAVADLCLASADDISRMWRALLNALLKNLKDFKEVVDFSDDIYSDDYNVEKELLPSDGEEREKWIQNFKDTFDARDNVLKEINEQLREVRAAIFLEGKKRRRGQREEDKKRPKTGSRMRSLPMVQ